MIRLVRGTGFTLGVEVAPLRRDWRALMWALHLGPWSIVWYMRWWL